ncbi:alanine racemase [bacterium]|nr:alanine racemase [bacterium]
MSFHASHSTTIAQIDLQRFAHNIRVILDYLNGVHLIAIVKANGYGHGITGMIPVFSQFPRVWLGVPTLDEALELRSGGAPNPILLLSYINPARLPLAVANSCRLTVHHLDHIKWYARAAQAATDPVKLHLKADTGMARLGIAPEDLDQALDMIESEKMLHLEGFFSHLVESSIKNDVHNIKQTERFDTMLSKVRQRFPGVSCVHLANSGGTLNFPKTHYDMVRVGILCYGIYPPDYSGDKLDIAPVLALKSQVHDYRTVRAGSGVSYSHKWLAPCDTTLIAIPIGYADGYQRSMSGKCQVLFRGKRCPVVGTITMDYIVADVNGLGTPELGEEVVLIGEMGDEEITVEEVAEWADTIVYEITCGLGRRIRRVYI